MIIRRTVTITVLAVTAFFGVHHSTHSVTHGSKDTSTCMSKYLDVKPQSGEFGC